MLLTMTSVQAGRIAESAGAAAVAADHLVSRPIRVEGRAASYGVGGRGMPVLFLHGWALGHRSYRRALRRGGRYRCVGGPAPTVLSVLTLGAVVGVLTRRRIGVLAVRPGPARFSPLAERCATGEISISVERTFGLEEVPDALAHVGAGRALGKVVVVP